ncbi:MAG: hypothetical protein K5695_14725 [Oscillospiraceae bacterium]|nr:hypothetical protein [Oscillospiraceae bacterium]
MKSTIRISASVLFGLTLLLSQISGLSVSAANNGTFVYNRDAWKFSNSPDNFHESYTDNLFPEHERAIGENLNHVEYHLIDPVLSWDEFHGACYGFAATSMLASFDILDPAEHIEEMNIPSTWKNYGNAGLYSLDRLLHGNIHTEPLFEQSIIYYYMLLQSTDAVRQESIKTCDWTTKQKLSFLSEHGKNRKPVLLCYNGIVKDMYFGHAVVAYGTESGSWEFNGETYDARILVYDCSIPLGQITPEQYQMLYDESHLYYNTKDGKWTVPYYGITQDHCDLLGLIDDINVINDKGILPGSSYESTDWTDVVSTNQLSLPYSVTILDSEKSLKEHPWFYMDGDEQVRQNFVSDTANSCYTIKLESPQQLHSGVYYKDLAFQCDSQSGSQINYDPSGCVSISGEAAEYSLTMVLNDHYPTQWYDVQASGTASQASLQKTEQGYLLTADDLHEASLTAKNLDEKTLVSVSTDAKSVLFSENTSGLLVASTDLDGDGSYETELAKSRLLGDLNGDDTVNASDAALLLIAAAEIGAGNASGLTEGQEIAADVNYDYKINASDSASILIYAADIGAGSYAGTLAQYMRRDQS